MNAEAPKFNYLVLIFAAALVLSVFARFANPVGIQSAVFFVLAAAFLFEFNFFSIGSAKVLIPIVLFAVAIMISYYAADFKHNARNGVLLASYSGCAYLLSGFLNEKEKRSVLIMPLIIALWLTIYLLARHAAFASVLTHSAVAIAPASFLIMALSVSFIFWWGERPLWRYMSFVIFLAVILTKSYLAIALSALIFAAFLFFMRSRIKIKTYITVIPFLIVAAAALYLLTKSSFLADRMLSWSTALSVFKAHPLFGVGFMNYENVSLCYASALPPSMALSQNMFLQLLAETGIFGTLAFCSVIAAFFYRAAAGLKDSAGKDFNLPLILGVMAFMAFNLFETAAFAATNMLMFFIMLAAPAVQYKKEQRKMKISVYILIPLIIPLLVALGMPIYAKQEYKNGIMFYSSGRYPSALNSYTKAFTYDFMNPEYASKIADTYFAIYRESENRLDLGIAIEFAKRAIELNKYESRYYAQLAWLYHFSGDKLAASENITRAAELDKFDERIRQDYGELIY